MPRGRKKYTLEERYEKCVNDISENEERVRELKVLKKQLEKQVNDDRLSDLKLIMDESGLSVNELRAMIENRE